MLLSDYGIQELVALGRGAERSGDWTDALDQYSAALVQASEANEFPRAVELMRAIGQLHFERGDYERASEEFQQSLRRAMSAGDRAQIAASLNCQGVVAQFRGQVDVAENSYKRAELLAEESGDVRLVALIQQNLGILATIRGDYEQALEQGRKALATLRSLGDELASARVLVNIGMLHAYVGELGHAELSYRSALTLADRAGDAGLRVKVQINRAELALRRKDFDAAHEFCSEAFRTYMRLGSESGLGETYRLYGMLYRETGNAQLASTHLLLALRLAQACGNRLLEAESEHEQALLLLQSGRHRDAIHALNNAHRVFQELRARRELADIERKLERVEGIYLRAVEMFESATPVSVEPGSAEQCQRVARYTAKLAAEAGFSGRDVTWLRIGSFLYDIGKRSVPEQVLNKPGKLDSEEWKLVEQHVLESDQVVADLDLPWDMRPMVRHHHEHWDGTGYPDGLKGEEIPLAARVLCIVDAFTALTSPRGYRPAMSEPEALAVMEQEAGTTFDPALFGAFRALVEN